MITESFILSEGTLRSEDLLNACAGVIFRHASSEVQAEFENIYADSSIDENDKVDMVYDIMQDLCTGPLVFGGHPDDPACVGYWDVSTGEFD